VARHEDATVERAPSEATDHAARGLGHVPPAKLVAGGGGAVSLGGEPSAAPMVDLAAEDFPPLPVGSDHGSSADNCALHKSFQMVHAQKAGPFLHVNCLAAVHSSRCI